MIGRNVQIALALGALAAAACHRADSPAAPSTAAPQVNATAIAITGSTSIERPGATTELAATVTFSDGTTRDVTGDATWASTDNGIVAVAAPGLIKAVRYGPTQVWVTFRSGRAPVVQTSVNVRVAPAGAFFVSGAVITRTGVRLPGTVVESRSEAGVLGVTADDIGWYIAPVLGAGILRIEKNGFLVFERIVTADHDTYLDLELLRADSGGLTGSYELTFIASRSCHLPPLAMQRTYEVQIEQVQQTLYAMLRGSQFVAWGGQIGFTGTVDGTAVEFQIRDTYDDGYNLIERIDGVGDLHYAGTARGAISGSHVVAQLRGAMAVTPAWGMGVNAACTADDHRMELVRIDGQ
jgi:hypothetical protein